MTNKEMHHIMVLIQAVHPRYKISNQTLSVWNSLFENVEYLQAAAALKKFLKGSPFQPKPADILALIPARAIMASIQPRPLPAP